MQASRGPLSLLAGTRARTLAALGYAASEESPAARAPSLASANGRANRAREGRSWLVQHGFEEQPVAANSLGLAPLWRKDSLQASPLLVGQRMAMHACY